MTRLGVGGGKNKMRTGSFSSPLLSSFVVVWLLVSYDSFHVFGLIMCVVEKKRKNPGAKEMYFHRGFQLSFEMALDKGGAYFVAVCTDKLLIFYCITTCYVEQNFRHVCSQIIRYSSYSLVIFGGKSNSLDSRFFYSKAYTIPYVSVREMCFFWKKNYPKEISHLRFVFRFFKQANDGLCLCVSDHVDRKFCKFFFCSSKCCVFVTCFLVLVCVSKSVVCIQFEFAYQIIKSNGLQISTRH